MFQPVISFFMVQNSLFIALVLFIFSLIYDLSSLSPFFQASENIESFRWENVQIKRFENTEHNCQFGLWFYSAILMLTFVKWSIRKVDLQELKRYWCNCVLEENLFHISQECSTSIKSSFWSRHIFNQTLWIKTLFPSKVKSFHSYHIEKTVKKMVYSERLWKIHPSRSRSSYYSSGVKLFLLDEICKHFFT
jgi:hypothetical protein